MTDSEINEAVARKLGWTFCQHGGASGAVRPNPIKPHFHEVYPDYCHSIAAAWEIVEQPGLIWMIGRDRNGYSAGVCRDSGTDINTMANTWAETAPMAICLAFLKVP